jgi:hypothetical protein
VAGDTGISDTSGGGVRAKLARRGCLLSHTWCMIWAGARGKPGRCGFLLCICKGGGQFKQ